MISKLSAFVRAHRERLTPESIGLPRGERRRTPGLRREELAALCGVSTTWITWLEQGRPVSASAKMLSRLAVALRLSEAERSYLFRLADRVDPEAPKTDLAGEQARNLSRLVDAIATPAYVLDRQWNAVAWNEKAAELFVGWLSSAGQQGEHNLLKFVFLQGSAREFIVDWPTRARRLVAEFRAECGKTIDDPPISDLIRVLREQSSDFLQRWDAQEVVTRDGGTRTFMHPVAGLLVFEQMTLQLQGRPDLKLTMLLDASR
jgi:transcriptional regulator with XRE-family HTH domain